MGPKEDFGPEQVASVQSKLRNLYASLPDDEKSVIKALLNQAFPEDAEVSGFAFGMSPLVNMGWTFSPGSVMSGAGGDDGGDAGADGEKTWR